MYYFQFRRVWGQSTSCWYLGVCRPSLPATSHILLLIPAIGCKTIATLDIMLSSYVPQMVPYKVTMATRVSVPPQVVAILSHRVVTFSTWFGVCDFIQAPQANIGIVWTFWPNNSDHAWKVPNGRKIGQECGKHITSHTILTFVLYAQSCFAKDRCYNCTCLVTSMWQYWSSLGAEKFPTFC